LDFVKELKPRARSGFFLSFKMYMRRNFSFGKELVNPSFQTLLQCFKL